MQPQLIPVLTGALAILSYTPIVSSLVIFSNSPTPSIDLAIPLSLTMPPRTSCPAAMVTCNDPLSGETQTHCCPSGDTCMRKKDVFGVTGWGCCNTSNPNSKCATLEVVETKKCARQEWSVCGGAEGGAKCCAGKGMCREVNDGGMKWDCGGNATVTGEDGGSLFHPVRGNGTNTGGEDESAAWRVGQATAGRMAVMVVGAVVGVLVMM